MILKSLLKVFSTTLYVQLWENRIKVTDIDSKQTYDEPPYVALETTKKGEKEIVAVGRAAENAAEQANVHLVNPLSHPRSILADFEVGEKLLQHAFKMLARYKWLPPSPRVVIHPMEKTEGGLTVIELRALRELGLGAGGREIVIHRGEELAIHGFNYGAIKAANERLV